MYRHFISEAERDRIINEYNDPNTPPHCNDQMFHQPKVCAFCDGYYRLNPDFVPVAYVTSEANGWGGNQAPMVDNMKAAEEDAAWKRAFEMLDRG